MNILDNLILIVFVAVFFLYCYKKKKFVFKKKDNPDTPKDASGTANVFPNMAVFPQMYQGIQGGFRNFCGNNPIPMMGITFCRIIPWTFSFNPLPFVNPDEQADNAVNSDVSFLGETLDSEIRTLNSDGYTVTGISMVSLPLGDNAVRVLFCITCMGNGYSKSNN